MTDSVGLEDVLEIFLITYNRSALLDKTLCQLKDSPFARCRFTILDNCSTDDTPNITAKYRGSFPDYHVIRHPRNIGGSNNYLRGVELSTKLYTWIVCDDDDFDFTDVTDVIQAIVSCNYEIIYVGPKSTKQFGWSGSGGTTAWKLIEDNARYHRALSFYPAMIFKSEKFDFICYVNAPYLFPSMLFIQKSARENYSVYIARSEVVVRYEGTAMDISPLYLYKEWVTTAARIEDTDLRRKVIEQMTDEGFMKTLFFWIAMEKVNRREGFGKRLFDIFYGYTYIQKMKMLLLIPAMVIPLRKDHLLRARELVYRLKGNKEINKLPPTHIAE